MFRDDVEIRGLLYDFLTNQRDRAKLDDKRHDELVRVHREGWEKTARAVADGFRLVAEALRRR